MILPFWRWAAEASHNDEAEDAEFLLRDAEHLQTEKNRKARQGSSIPKIILLVISHCLLAAFAAFLGSRWRLDPASFCARLTAKYSPVIKDVGLKYTTVQFNGSFFHETAFRKDAGPEVDAAWGSLGADYRAVIVPAEQAERSGLASDQVKVSQKYGGGYPANVEGLHHLHCLNLLRKALYYNFDYYHALGEGAFKNNDRILKYHITHCLDILRQQLMCTVDVGMLGQVWWDPTFPKPFVDFNTKHVCRNFEEVRTWAEVRQMPKDVPHDFLEPPEEDDTVYESVP